MPFVLFTFMLLSFNIFCHLSHLIYIPFLLFFLSLFVPFFFFYFSVCTSHSCYLFLLTLSTSFTHHIYSLSFLSYSSQLISVFFFCLSFSSSLFRYGARFFIVLLAFTSWFFVFIFCFRRI